MSRLLLIFLLFHVPVSAKLFLKDDLKRDEAMLNEHGTYMTDADRRKFKVFNTYANIDLSMFKFSKRKIGKHVISKWNGGRGKLCIYQIETTLHVDTLLDNSFNVIDSPSKTLSQYNVVDKIPIKADFKFRTYIMDVPDQNRLTYLTQKGVGLIEFTIGDKSYSPVHEDIMYGVIYPDMNEINKLIKNK